MSDIVDALEASTSVTECLIALDRLLKQMNKS